MRNLLVEISYKGTAYHGYQVQKNALTVAEVLQNGIEKVLKVREPIVGCSRTDSGVHARQFFFHMKTESNIPCEALLKALNNNTPGDIAVKSIREVPLDFHARYHVKEKEYRYLIWNDPVKDPFLENLAYHFRYPLDEKAMDRLSKAFIGTYDFSSFCSVGGSVEDKVRTVFDCSVTRTGSLVEFIVRGDGFLYNMVRIMVGTLILGQREGWTTEDIKAVILSKDRAKAGDTVPPEGLYLNRVIYPCTEQERIF